MRFLIAGHGSIGRRHLRNLLALGERDIVLLRSGRSTLPLEEAAEFPSESELTRALDHHPEAVIVSNPTALHLDVAIPAAEAGCHILLEKPVSHSMARVRELVDAAGRTGARVCVGFQYRFHPGLSMSRTWIEEGALGQVVSAHAHYGDYLPAWHPWEDYRQSYSARADLGGGVILTLCHPLDYLRWLLGEVVSVWGMSARPAGLEIDVDGMAEIGLHFASGAMANVHLDFIQQPPSHAFEIVGTRASIHWNQADGIARFEPWEETSAERQQSPAGFGRDEMFVDEMKHFIRVCRGEVEPVCPLEDGIAALRLALAADRSARERTAVSPDDHALDDLPQPSERR